MLAFVIRRLLLAIPVLWGVLTLVFLSIHLLPGDPAQIMLYGKGTGNSADVIALRHQLGLDQPLPVQYWNFIKGAIHLDFGTSITSKRPVFTEIMDRLPTTASLAAFALAFSLVLGLLAGSCGAVLRMGPIGKAVTVLTIVGISIPEFWSGPLLAWLFGLKLAWLPVAGLGDLRNFILPALTLAVGTGCFLARIVRASMTEVFGAHHVRTARAKGLSSRTITVRHVLRNSLIPLLTVIGLTIAGLLGGVVIVENVFALPGLGTLAVGAVAARDFPVIEGTTFFFAAILMVANLLVDLSYVFVDPRIRVS
jgi:peptide/nickel transport system permease protein